MITVSSEPGLSALFHGKGGYGPSDWMWTWPISWPRYLDVKVIFIRPDTYDQQIPKLLAGESDIIMAAMTRHDGKSAAGRFLQPLFRGQPGRHSSNATKCPHGCKAPILICWLSTTSG